MPENIERSHSICSCNISLTENGGSWSLPLERRNMRREAQLIKQINSYLKNPTNSYNLIFSEDDLRIIKEALIDRHIKGSRIVAGDVVTDNGYHQEVVITRIDSGGYFQGYYVADGVTVKGLEISKFTKIADRSGEWKTCRGGVYFQSKSEEVIG